MSEIDTKKRTCLTCRHCREQINDHKLQIVGQKIHECRHSPPCCMTFQMQDKTTGQIQQGFVSYYPIVAKETPICGQWTPKPAIVS